MDNILSGQQSQPMTGWWMSIRRAVGPAWATCLLVVLMLVSLPGRICLGDTGRQREGSHTHLWRAGNRQETGRLPFPAPTQMPGQTSEPPSSSGQEVTAETHDLPAWVLVYPYATFVARSSGDAATESGYFTLVTNDILHTVFDFYKQTYEEKVNETQFALDFMALSPRYGELWLTGTANETVRVAMVSAAAASPVAASPAAGRKTFIYVSYTRSTDFESAYRHPMSEIGDLADLDFQPTRFECELDSDERFLFSREYLKAIHFVHRQHLTSRAIEFGPLVEAGSVSMPASESAPGQPDKLPPWVIIYPGARLLAKAVDARKTSGTLILATDQGQEQVYGFYNQRLKELYRSFGLERSSWSQDVEFSTADWTNGADKLLSVITLQDKSPQTVVLLRYKGEAPRIVKPHRRHPAARRP
ncbi:hypothetical protein [Chloracidobacterium aggregatum]|uniref:Uncharacterized protein n=1 Tax=Chloracidobacterium sp. N TaxID=2821540 RepID=A0ABX8AZX6_9BACT|nr:hypothetical protein [Chloracidobacterium aggregatum]QUV87801.1 hypothetical protein J8C07_00155 [Chloracidobacterium sp. S]QUV90701.1 hypothetical protein J8C04_10710 [Chloracidobacterium sp. A]QUV93917.1 hypothetical protein J8C05_00155 [Chloracidobacterium sp. N]QUV97107.1 hypothetical protein J8C00_01180 [Chloracidobacterium sp. E]